MKRLIAVFALIIAVRVVSQAAVDNIAAGRAALAAHDLATAQSDFQQALALDPSNETAAALLGAVQLLNVVNQASSQTLMTDAGVTTTGRDIYGWNADLPKDADNSPIFPAAFNTSEAFAFLHDTLVPACETARTNLALVTDPNFLLTLSAAETDSPASVTIDYGDVLACRAGLNGAEFLLHFLQSNNLNFSPQAVVQMLQGNTLTIENVLTTYPDLLKTGTAGERAAALASLRNFIQTYRQASAFIRSRPTGAQRLFMLDAKGLIKEADFRKKLDKVEQSLDGYVNFGKDASGPVVYAGALFSDSLSLRALLPQVTNGKFNPFEIPDPTMGGIFSGVAPEFFPKAFSYLADPSLGWKWINPTPNGFTYTGYAYGNGTHVVLGGMGHFRTSTDGINWTDGSISGKPLLNSVIFAGGKFVAVGLGCSYSSTDGLNWSAGSGIGSSNYNGLLYVGGRFATVGSNGGMATSTDGVAWSSSNVGFSENYVSLAYANGRAVAVGGDRVISSTDGSTWTSQATVSGTLTSVTTNGSLFVAVGSPNILLTSTDGLTWTTGTVLSSPGYVPSFNGVSYSGGKFIAVGSKSVLNSSICLAASSTDGTTWTALSLSQLGSLNQIKAGPDALFALGSAGLLLRSTDGVTFTQPSGYSYSNIAPAFGSFNGFFKLGGNLYVFGAGGMMLTSSDGSAFTPVSTGTAAILNAGIVVNGTAYVVGSRGTIISSTNGTTWTALTSNTTADLNGIASGNGILVAVGKSATSVSSSDGITWTANSHATVTVSTSYGTGTGTFLAYDVAFGNGTFVAVGGFTGTGNSLGWSFVTTATSTDGGTWTLHPFTNTRSNAIRSVVFHDGIFTAAATYGNILRSSDGVTWDWANDTGGFDNDVLSVGLLDDGRYWATVAASSSSGETLPPARLLVSGNGEDWVSMPLPTTANLYRAALFNNKVYLAGGGTTLLASSLAVPSIASPTIFKDPQTESAGAGSTINVAAGVTGYGTLHYQWQKDGVDIVGATGPVLTLSDAQAADSGTYTVIVTNDAGSQTSGAGVITVTPRAPVIAVQPADQAVPAGWSAVFSVQAVGVNPLTYQWKKDGNALADGADISGARTATLQVTGVQASAVGQYSVVVTDSVGSTTSNAASLGLSTADPVFSTRLVTEDAIDRSPGRTIHDGLGHIYMPWTLMDLSYDVIGGKRVGALVRLDEATGALDPTFLLDRRIRRVGYAVIQPDGKLILGADVGNSTTVVRVDATGAIDATFQAPLIGHSVRFLTLQPDGKVLVAAVDLAAGYVPQGAPAASSQAVFRLNADGSLDTTFTEADVDSVVFCAPVLDSAGNVYIGGAFSEVNGTTRPGIARLSGTGVLDTAYAGPSALPGGFTVNQIRGILLQSSGNAVVIGRMYYGAKGTSSDPVVAIRLDQSGTFDSTFACPLKSATGMLGTSALRAAVMQSDDKFVTVSDRIIRFNADGTIDSTFPVSNVGLVSWISKGSDGRLYVPDIISDTVTTPTGTSSVPDGHVAAFSADGIFDPAFQPAAWAASSFPTSGAVLSDGRVWVAGNFNDFAGNWVPGLAQFMPSKALSLSQASPSGSDDFLSLPAATLAPASNDQVYVLWTDNEFNVNAPGAAMLNKVNADGSIDSTFSPGIDTSNLYSASLTAMPSGDLIVCRPSYSAQEILNNDYGNLLKRISSDGSQVTGYSGLPNVANITRDANNSINYVSTGGVHVLEALSDGSFLVAVNGVDGNVRLYHVLAGGSTDGSFTSPVFGTVSPVWGYSDSVYDPVTSQTLQVAIGDYSQQSLITSAIQIPSGKFYVGGSFSLSGVPAGLARINADGTLDTTFTGTGVSNSALPGPAVVNSVTVDASGRVYVAGVFDSFNGTAVPGLFRLNADGSLDTAWTPGVGVLQHNYGNVNLVAEGTRLYLFGEVGASTDKYPGVYQVLDIGAAQTISFSGLSNMTFGDAPFSLGATATSSLGVTYSVVSGPATISGNTVTITGPGTVIIEADQAGDSIYDTAVSVQQSFTIAKATPQITWTAPGAITYGTPLSSTQLNATANVAGSFAYTPDVAAVLSAGAQTLSVTFTPADATNYTSVTTTRSLTVNPATPSVTWTAPAAITYGTALSAAQLNATANVAGSFAYTPAAAAVLSAGAQTLSVTFTPADATNYTSVTTTRSLSVNPATPVVTWTAPAAITYGTPLSAVQLDATANVAGTFSYAPNAGAVPGLGEQTLNVTFAPTDTANYTSASASTRILVTGYATTTNPDGTVSITGSAGLAGAITIPSSVDGKAVTGIGQSAFAGCTELTSVTIPASVASIGDQAFSGCTGLTSVTISSGVKTIGADAFDGCTSLSAITLPESLTSIGDNAFAGCSSLVTVTIPAGVTSIGASPFAYCSDLTAIGVESGNTAYASVDGVLYDITLTTLVQFPPGYSGTNEQVPQMLQPARALVTAPGSSSSPNFRIRTSFVIPSCVTHIGTGAFAGSVNLSTVVVPGSVTLIDEGAFTDCAVLNTLSFQGNAPTVGTTAFSGDSNLTTVSYAQGTTGWTATVAGVATVQKSAPTLTWATPANFSYGTLLSAAQLNATANVAGDFSYSPAAGTLLAAGLHSLSVTFTPTDTADYSTAAATQVVNVNLTTPAITWPAPAAITYGTALSSTQLNATASVSGSFAYTPAAATILTPGSQTLSVTFTPDDTADYSTATATQTLLVNPAAPASDPAEAVVATGFQAVWSPVVGATGYYLDVSTDSAFSSFVTGYQALDVHNVTELGIAGLNPGTAYYYRVRAYDGTSTGLNSATTTVSTTATVSITSPLTVSTLAGSALVYGSADGTASAARFWYPSGLAVDASSNVVVADTDNNTIRKVTAAGVVTTIAGRAGLAGTADGSGTAAQFDRPSGIAIDGSGNTYIADTLNNTVRKMTSAGVVSTIAGQAGVAGNADGVGSAALFHGPQGLSVDASGNLYIADTNNQIVRKLVLSTGVVSTVAGSKGAAGSVDGTGTAALFNSPTDLVADSSGNVYVADTDNHTVRKLTSSGVVTTIAGHAGYSGGADGTGSAATFDSPSAITIDASGNLYVGDTGNFTIRQVVPSTGAVTTLAGLAGTSGSTDGLGSAARFFQPAGIVADSSGNLYIADTDNHTIRLGVLAAAPAIQSQPQSATVTAGASVSFSVTATGHPTLSYQWYFNGAAISGATSSSYSISSAQASNAGSYTVTVTNVIKSVTSNAATLTVSAATQPTKSGGGGGAPSWWFLVAVATLGIARFAHRRRNSP